VEPVGGGGMGWWVIEYDNKKFDSHKFMRKLQVELMPLFIAAGGGPAGAGVFHPVSVSDDSKERFYFNSKVVSIPRIRELLSIYGAKECPKPTEFCGVFIGNHVEPLNQPWIPKT
jgi:hypothetical protein